VAALVTEIDQGLLQEGLANEVVRRVQELRKQAGFSVDDRIAIEYDGTSELSEAIAAHHGHIAAETLGVSLEPVNSPVGFEDAEFKFQGQELKLAISRSDPE